MLFWQKAFKSIAYGDVQSVRIFVSEMGMAKQCQLNTMMVCILGWSKGSFGLFCKMLGKNLNEQFRQTNIFLYILAYPDFL